MSWLCTKEAGKTLKHVTFPGPGLVCEEPLLVQMTRLTGWNTGWLLNRKARWVRFWRLMTKLLPAAVGWLHNDRMVEQSQDLMHIEKGREKGVAWTIRQTPV